MKRFLSIFLTAVLALGLAVPALAQDGQAIYSGSAEEFIFQPGSEFSPTDLFPNFKDVMPGDSIQQKIMVRNDPSKEIKVRIYLRALGAHEGSEEFLSQLHLTVTEDTDTLLFDAPADQTAQLTDWVYLGTLYSGGECQLTVTLDVPVTLDNEFKNLIGYLDWEFAVEELPTEQSDPKPPHTGDDSNILLWSVLLGVSILVMLLLIFGRKRKEKQA